MSFRERIYEEEQNWAVEEERRREREREHAPASPEELTQQFTRILEAAVEMAGEPVCQSPPIGPDPILLMVVQVPHGTEGAVVRAVAKHASMRGVTLMLWEGRPRRRHRRGMRLLFGRRLGQRLTG